mmetsp:Transcript_31236/g.42144  ORF Transcript_31236/g.42144 Transcript_31236/m.42144 type:complete len:232 (-) Transcript_31236:345-1040(-)
MDRLRNNVQQTLDLAIEQPTRRRSSSLLHDHCHGESLVEHAQLALGILVVRRVQIDPTVQDGPVNVGDHGSDVTRGIRLGALFILVDDCRDCLVPVRAVALVAAVDLLASTRGQLNVGLDVDKLPQRWVQCESVHAVAFESNDKLGGRSVHAVPGNDDIVSRPQHIAHLGHPSALLLVDRKDRACAHIAVDIAASIQWVEGHNETPSLLFGHKDRLVVLFRNKHGCCASIH